jgi:hypothetical protein
MAIIGFMLAPGFDGVEFRVLCSRLREAGHRTIIISRARGELLVSRKMSKLVLVDGGLDHYAPTAFSALVILGGKDPGYLQTRFDTSIVYPPFCRNQTADCGSDRGRVTVDRGRRDTWQASGLLFISQSICGAGPRRMGGC